MKPDAFEYETEIAKLKEDIRQLNEKVKFYHKELQLAERKNMNLYKAIYKVYDISKSNI